MLDKKALKAQYKQMKKEMGLYSFTCLNTGKVYIGWAQDLKGKINGTRARLNGGLHPSANLSADWQRWGEGGFLIQVAERLSYDEEESKTDYGPDLEVLLELWLAEHSDLETERLR